MKKIIIIALAIACLALLISCQVPEETVEPAQVEEQVIEQSSEEIEVDTALDEIDQLEQDFEEDFGLDELDNLEFE